MSVFWGSFIVVLTLIGFACVCLGLGVAIDNWLGDWIRSFDVREQVRWLEAVHRKLEERVEELEGEKNEAPPF